MKKILFIDRDGTILVEPEDEQVDTLDKVDFLPGVLRYLGKITREMDYELVMVTNQDGLGTSSFPEDNFWPIQNHILRVLESERIHFNQVFIDRSFPKDNLTTRKPGTALLTRYMNNPKIDIANSFVIGDRESDVMLAQNLGCKSIYISENNLDGATTTINGWQAIYSFLKSQNRTSQVSQKTNETDISIWLDLDGVGTTKINTGIRFFDHMLDQLGKHGGVDLEISTKGDLNVDEHHTIEDTGLALGMAFNQALAKRAGIERYGFLLPMDDCMAQVAIDFGGRPWFKWEADFKREKVGEMPTEMFSHFFKSFSDTAKCNLHIKAEGDNEHHKIEAIFKAWAKSIRMAIEKTSDNIPSTKGIL